MDYLPTLEQLLRLARAEAIVGAVLLVLVVLLHLRLVAVQRDLDARCPPIVEPDAVPSEPPDATGQPARDGAR